MQRLPWCRHCARSRGDHHGYIAACPDGSGTTWTPATAGETTTKEN